jgi:hypothetical protein|tara:strand:- start:120 stop:794 length:675 start_codon:yes stop_codon:yes gene_type:complete
MRFDTLYEDTIRRFLFEKKSYRIALLPGGFKPPHKGHFEALKHIISENDATHAIVFIGTSERDGINADQSKAIWDIYADYIDIPVKVKISSVSPVKSVYDFADDNKKKHLFVGAGEDDMKRYAWFEKNADEFPLVELTPIPPKFGRISGTETREKILNGADDALDFVPHEAESDLDIISRILNIESADEPEDVESELPDIDLDGGESPYDDIMSTSGRGSTSDL